MSTPVRWLAVLSVWFLACADSTAASKVVLVAGGDASLVAPFGIDFHPSGEAYVVELTGGRFFRLGSSGKPELLGGVLQKKGDAGDRGPVASAVFNGMHSLAIGREGRVYLADTWNNRVRVYDPKTGQINAFAGTGEKGDEGEGIPAAKARMGGIYCVALDPAGNRLILTDLDMRRIRAVDLKTGVIHTVAGNGKKGVPENGAEARMAPLVDPRAAVADAQGNIYILERSGHALRVVNKEGQIRTVAGTGKAGLAGDGGPALKATLNGPKHLCLDRDGGVLIADTENHVIRKYLPREGTIVRVAGTGKKGTGGLNGPPEAVELNQPHGITLHPDGSLYITDSSNHRILKLER